MDYVLDIIFGLISAVFKEIRPNCKLKKRQEIFMNILSVLLLLGSIACFIAGIHLLSVGLATTLGKILLSVGISLIFLQCTAYAVLIGRHFKSEAERSRHEGEDGDDGKD